MKNCPRCQTQHNKNGTYCSRSCANARVWTTEDKLKKSVAAKNAWKLKEHPMKGQAGWKHSDEMKEIKRQRAIEQWDRVGRKTSEQRAIQNRNNTHNYRARKRNAISESSDLKLIKRIIEACPKGYDVDHIISLSKGGMHHQDNLQYLPSSENRRKNNRDVFDEELVIKWQDVLVIKE